MLSLTYLLRLFRRAYRKHSNLTIELPVPNSTKCPTGALFYLTPISNRTAEARRLSCYFRPAAPPGVLLDLGTLGAVAIKASETLGRVRSARLVGLAGNIPGGFGLTTRSWAAPRSAARQHALPDGGRRSWRWSHLRSECLMTCNRSQLSHDQLARSEVSHFGYQPRARHSSRWGRSAPRVESLPCPG
jgi:hypothetical protein